MTESSSISTMFEKACDRLDRHFSSREKKQVLSQVFDYLLDYPEVRSPLPFDLALISVLDDAIERLNHGEPVQYITGIADFYGRKFIVNRDVLIPRSETEELVYAVANKMKESANVNGMKVLDIGTGSGCIAITLKDLYPQAHFTALDVSPLALEVAAKNAIKMNTSIDFREEDYLKPSKWMQETDWDIIISNPPYITISEQQSMDSSVLNYEPTVALFARDDDPIMTYHSILSYGTQHLKSGGFSFLELNEFRGAEILSLCEAFHFSRCWIEKDMQDKDRILICQK